MYVKTLIFSLISCVVMVFCTPVVADEGDAQGENFSVRDSTAAEQSAVEYTYVSDQDRDMFRVYNQMKSMGWDADDGSYRQKIFEKMHDYFTNESNKNRDSAQSDAVALAEEKEQSLKNRILGAVGAGTVGIGGMMAASALSEQAADKKAEADMSGYVETFRCEYGSGKSVKASNKEIELPGGNDKKIMDYRNEYLTLANSLKLRKEALGLKTGIESEKIIDKSETGLYDDEFVGINSGNEASIYRATVLDVQEDKEKIADMKESADNHVTYGATAAGIGAVGGVVGDILINGKTETTNKDNNKITDLLKSKLKSFNLSGTELSSLTSMIQNIDFSNLSEQNINGLLNTSTSEQFNEMLSGLL